MRVIGDVTTLTGESLWTLEGLVHPSYLSTQSRFVDRDMMMRYHWSLGIGHTYSHTNNPDSQSLTNTVMEMYSMGPNEEDDTMADTGDIATVTPNNQADEEEPDPDDPEFTMDDRENEDIGSDGEYDDERFNSDQEDDELYRTYYM